MPIRSLTGREAESAILGRSPPIVRLRAEIARLARFPSTVLITGPTGTGKELVARQIHLSSPRSRQPFIPVDCTLMTGELMSSQLFGHVAGAFTGANSDALGCFRAANLGTLFLDEVGELEYGLQAKLLRVLQEHVVVPVGSHQEQAIDVRVIAATNRNLGREVHGGKFREDLYYRLDVAHVQTMGLCDRREDIPTLAESFLRQLADQGLPECSLSSEAIRVLSEYYWPGNVRQLRNVLEQAAIDTDESVIQPDRIRRILSLSFDFDGSADTEIREDLPSSQSRGSEPFQPKVPAVLSDRHSPWPTLDELERQHIAHTLDRTFFNCSAAARLLGLTRQSLLRRMARYGLDGRRPTAD